MSASLDFFFGGGDLYGASTGVEKLVHLSRMNIILYRSYGHQHHNTNTELLLGKQTYLQWQKFTLHLKI